MNNTPQLTLPAFFAQTVSKHKLRYAMALVGETHFTYDELDRKIRSLMRLLEELGFQPGDRAAILSTNMPNWAVSYYAITFMGGVAVPILPDFHQSEIETILTHSEAGVLFISDAFVI